jgi:hypothetical protein
MNDVGGRLSIPRGKTGHTLGISENTMVPHSITLADGRHLTLHDEISMLLELLTARPLDTRHVVAIGRRLFEDGGLEPLEALIDQIADQLGREPAYELVVLWTPIVEGDDGVP